MGKKEKITAVVVLVVVGAIVLAAVGIDKERQSRQAEIKAASEAQRASEQAARTYSQDEVVSVSSDDKKALAFSELQGSMDMVVSDAKLYDSYEATGLPTGDGHYFGPNNSPGNDAYYFLVCKVDIKNIDAIPLLQSKTGETGFMLSGPKANAAEFVYFDGSEANCPKEAGNYFSIAPGEEKALTACWQIPQNDGESDLPESVLFGAFGYLIKLSPQDCR